MLHQSNAYYERCHSADVDPARSVEQRERCWTAWLEHYSWNQPPRRVRYAERRVVALRHGETVAPLPDAEPEVYAATFYSTAASATSAEGDLPCVEAGETGAEEGAAPCDATPRDPGEGVDEATRSHLGLAEGGEGVTPREEPSDPTARALTGARVEPPPPERPPAREPPPGPAPRPPHIEGTNACRSVCTPNWSACVSRCGERGSSCVEACRLEYRVCMGACS